MRMAPPTPRLKGLEITVAPARRATSAVRSVDPSSTTSTRPSGRASWASFTTRATESSSFQAGRTTSTPSPDVGPPSIG